MIDGEQAAPCQPGDDIVPQVGLLQLGQENDPSLVPFGVPQRFTDTENRVGTDDLGFAEVEFHFAGSDPRGGDMQTHSNGFLVPLPLVFDDRSQLLWAEGTDAHCGSSSIVQSIVSR